MLEGFAYCQMIFAEGRPQDLLYLGVNNAFEKIDGIEECRWQENHRGYPGHQGGQSGINRRIYGRVSLTGKPERFEDYFEPLKAWAVNLSLQPGESDTLSLSLKTPMAERKRAEKILRESEDKFRHVFDYSAIGKSITFLSGEMQANKALCKMLGYSEEELKS